MKTCIFIILLLTFQVVLCQKMPSDYFNEAEIYSENKDYVSAIISYQFIVDNYKRNEFYPRAYYTLGFTFFLQKSFDKAIPILKSILESDFNEFDKSGGGIMADPYTNYRHRASRDLNKIYFEKEMYELLPGMSDLSSTEFVAALYKELVKFWGSENFEDDVCIISLSIE